MSTGDRSHCTAAAVVNTASKRNWLGQNIRCCCWLCEPTCCKLEHTVTTAKEFPGRWSAPILFAVSCEFRPQPATTLPLLKKQILTPIGRHHSAVQVQVRTIDVAGQNRVQSRSPLRCQLATLLAREVHQERHAAATTAPTATAARE